MGVALLVTIVLSSVTLDVSDPWVVRTPELRFDIDDPWSDATPTLDRADPWQPEAGARRVRWLPRLDRADPWAESAERSKRAKRVSSMRGGGTEPRGWTGGRAEGRLDSGVVGL